MKKLIIFLLTEILLCVMMSELAFGDDTKLYTTVPKEHTIKLVISGNGNVSVNGTIYTSSGIIKFPRHSSVQINVNPASGSYTQYASYDSMLLSGQIYNRSFLISDLNCDGVFTVAFGKSIIPSVKTGDKTPYVLWLCVFSISAALSIVLLRKLKQSSKPY